MKKILVIGGNGQLGHCLQKIAPKYHNLYDFNFTGSAVIDITNYDQVDEAFAEYQPDFVINASAYTAVDLAEKESDRAFAVNSDAVGNLAKVCKDNDAVLIHVSTDYVFDGETNLNYSEDDFTNPIGVYGASKRKGEELALDNNPETVILRTSWLYSEFNKNFVKTMLHLFEIKDELGIVGDQHGQPTNANDLAEAIMDIIEFQNKTFGIYHFSNYPETTWFEFANKIKEFSGSEVNLKSITTEEFPTPAKRPKRSTMSLEKIEKDYNIEPKHWENSLRDCVEILNKRMRKLLFIILLFCFQLFYLQEVTLNKVDKVNDNKEKIFYSISDVSKSEYLGEVLVNGFSKDDVKMFGEIYKKAKQIGANTFSLKPIEKIDGTFQQFDPGYYILNLYYTKSDDIPAEDNVAFLISSSDNNQKISVNNKILEIHPRSFLRLQLRIDEVLTVSTRKLLGSSVKLSGKDGQPSLYFSLSNFTIRTNDSIYGGINLKSGDIIGLEKSFGMFLTTIYSEQKND